MEGILLEPNSLSIHACKWRRRSALGASFSNNAEEWDNLVFHVRSAFDCRELCLELGIIFYLPRSGSHFTAGFYSFVFGFRGTMDRFAEVSRSHDFKGLCFFNVLNFLGSYSIEDGAFPGRSIYIINDLSGRIPFLGRKLSLFGKNKQMQISH